LYCRPGRIDRKIEFPHPNEAAREHILRIHSRKMNLMRGSECGTGGHAAAGLLRHTGAHTSRRSCAVDLAKVASLLGTANGAECKAVCTEAGMFALRERRVHVTQEDFLLAATKVLRKDSEKDTSVAKLFK